MPPKPHPQSPPTDPASQTPEAPARAKALPLWRPSELAEGTRLLPARMLNEALYCERLMYLEWVQQEFADNHFTVEGRSVHRHADAEGKPLRELPGEGDVITERDGEPLPYVARAVWLSSEKLGITAKMDVVENDGAGGVTPIEYKRGKRPDLREGAYLPERAQLCAQVLLLREHGFSCENAEIYYAEDRQRTPIVIDAVLISVTLAAIARAREVAEAEQIPPPLVDSPKCFGCSLSGICLPDETRLLRALEGQSTEEIAPSPASADDSELYGPLERDPWDLTGPEPRVQPALRRLQPARDERVPLYVQEQGAQLALSGEILCVRRRDAPALEARLPNTSEVNAFGQVQVTTQAMRALLERGIPLTLFSSGGWFLGRLVGHDSKNVQLRLAHYAAASSREMCLRLARGFVVSKILNCRTLLRRNLREENPVVLSELSQLARKADNADQLEELLGIEGSAARAYFSAFTGMLRQETQLRETFDYQGRNRRPPRDPLNALLSFCYSLLAKDFSVILSSAGLDPLLGFYHQPRFGRPGLALDLMEEFRPLVADSTVLNVINTETIQADDFVYAAGSVALKAPARKRLLMAYERRLEQPITHPLFGYRVSYRRIFEIQARLLGRVLLGELKQYPSFRTR